MDIHTVNERVENNNNDSGVDRYACAHGGDMSSRASLCPCPQPPTTATTRWRLVKSTTAHGHRRRTGPGRLRTKLYGDRSPKQPGGGAAWGSRRALAAGAGPEAHHGAHCRLRALCSHSASSRCNCAADGGTAARRAPVLRHAHT